MSRSILDGYVTVDQRIVAFKEAFPEGSLQSEIVLMSDNKVVIKAYAYRSPEDARPGIGHAAEVIPGKTSFQRDSELMVCETSAWGRAIAALGFEVKRGVATQEEVAAAQGRQASPAVKTDPEKLATPDDQKKVFEVAVASGLDVEQVKALVNLSTGKTKLDQLTYQDCDVILNEVNTKGSRYKLALDVKKVG